MFAAFANHDGENIMVEKLSRGERELCHGEHHCGERSQEQAAEEIDRASCEQRRGGVGH
jgi:hypothetical protein